MVSTGKSPPNPDDALVVVVSVAVDEVVVAVVQTADGGQVHCIALCAEREKVAQLCENTTTELWSLTTKDESSTSTSGSPTVIRISQTART